MQNVLFLCTGNSARSVMAEALLTHHGHGRFRGYSAGSHPAGFVHPLTIETLARHGLATAELRSKSWDEFTGPDAPHFAFLFTVCDRAAHESCPVWPGHRASAHWGVPDPAQATGSPAGQAAAFESAYAALNTRITRFVSLPFDRLSPGALHLELQAIGRM